MGTPDHPVPSSRGYLKNLYPNSVKIIIEVCRIFNISNNKSKEIINKITNLKSKEPIDVPFQNSRDHSSLVCYSSILELSRVRIKKYLFDFKILFIKNFKNIILTIFYSYF